MNTTPNRATRTAEALLLIGLLAVLLIPLVWFDFLPTEDGPAHSALATVVTSLIGSTNQAIEHYYVLGTFPTPNLLGTVGLVSLQTVFPVLVAERIFVAVVVVGLAVSVRYARRGISSDTVPLELLAVPLGLGLISHFGFYNFMVGLVLFVVTFGYWQRHCSSEESVSIGRHVVVGILLLLTFLGHVLPFIATLFVIGLVSAGRTLVAVSGTHERWLKRVLSDYWLRMRHVLVAALPSLVLLGAYILRSDGGSIGGTGGLVGRLARFGTFGELFVVFSQKETVFAFLLAVTTAIGLVIAAIQRARQGREPRVSDGYLAAIIVFAAVFLVVPGAIAGGSAVPERIAMFTFIVSLFWLAQFRYENWFRNTIIVVSIVATIGLTAVRWSAYQGYNRDLAEYAAGTEVVTAESTVLPVFLIAHGSGVAETVPAYRVRPLIEAGSYATPFSSAVNLNHLHAEYSYSMAHFKPELNPRLLIGTPQGSAEGVYAVPPSVDILGYEEQTGETIDYVLMWGRQYATPETLSDHSAISLLAVLDQHYTVTFVSTDRGLMEVYTRNS